MRGGLFRSLGHARYRRLFFGQALSFCGSWMQHTAQGWLVYRLTGDPWQLGLTAFLGQVPVLLFGTWAGAVADAAPRRRIVMATQSLMMLQAAALAWLTLGGRVTVPAVQALAFFMGCLNAFDFPARQLLIGGSVPVEDRHNALGLHSAAVNSSRVLGPALAGFVVHAWGEGPCFALNAATYLALLWALSGLEDLAAHEGGAPHGLLEGLRRALEPEPLRLIFAALVAVSLAGMPYTVLLPLIADGVLGAGPRGLGFLMAAAGAGAAVAALYVAAQPSTRGFERLIGRAAALFGLGLIVFSRARSLSAACAVLALAGAALLLQLSGSNALLQEIAPPRLSGRVMALYGMALMGLGPLGSLALGALAARLGAPGAVAVGGAVVLAVGLAVSLRLPESVHRHRKREVFFAGPTAPEGL